MKRETPETDRIRKKLSALLDAERFRHSENVEGIARELAKRWGAPEEKAAVAGLLHDCSRWMTPKQMLEQARKLKFPVGEIEKGQPKLLHARLSARIARSEFGLKDKRVLEAIEKHTLGSSSMTVLDKIIYLADHIEGDRDYQGVDHVRDLAYKDLNKAVIESINSMLRSLIEKDLPIHEQTTATRNGLLL